MSILRLKIFLMHFMKLFLILSNDYSLLNHYIKGNFMFYGYKFKKIPSWFSSLLGSCSFFTLYLLTIMNMKNLWFGSKIIV